ncbi:Zn-dependent hydrolase [Leptospira perolatii]|uniref:Zn-dependent hydrolase n=1 Tax=Leptospira perolatii TaxID=2023191 RepID=A0A2M9ZJX0_9LEPT|nr:MBL fold metallo-hydrolase [Leptospira perolatii]PJZ69253.1 Zn-dependent hydrolase [Leptospira perolatii]PJZ72365.1 Zn-dependent hydrolase [Leptospira perolatii]
MFWDKNLFFIRLCVLVSAFYYIANCFPLDSDRTQSPNYKEGKYQNLVYDSQLIDKSFLTVLKWKLFGPHDPVTIEGLTDELPLVLERKSQDLIAPEGKLRIVWLGHSTAWISITKEGKTTNLITDPIFESPIVISRWVQLPIQKESLPAVDYALISHAHRDHLDTESLRYLKSKNPNLKILLPAGMKSFSEDEKLGNVTVQDWGQITQTSMVKIAFLPAHHWSRMGISDGNQYFWGSYSIEALGKTLYFGGDTGYSLHFKDVSKRIGHPIDLALLPIGAFKPRWFMKYAHISPEEAIVAAKDLNAKAMAPIHWGTFPLGDDLPQEPLLELRKHLIFPDKPDIHGVHPQYTGISWGEKDGVKVLPWTIGSGIDLN